MYMLTFLKSQDSNHMSTSLLLTGGEADKNTDIFEAEVNKGKML